MTTYVTMRSRISDELVNESLTTAQINAAIQSAIAHYQRKRFYFNESRAETFSTVASQEFYGTADNANIPNLSLIDKLTMTASGTRFKLTPRSWEWIDERSSTTTAIGQPTDYCYYAQQIRLYSIPDAVYTVRISGLVRFAALSADGDSNAWMTDGEALIRGRAKWDIGTNVIYSDEIAAKGSELEMSSLRALEAENTRRLSSSVRPYL